ncbi:hypothetical protein M2152_001471 [Microbacteriaceae bacterium SG_E_30_P1]|uniref:DUF4760 domain-containing protein n=1 Tax=Antiquaquibacter oligotrophicus TaxID=2880260 RepID=A0ABT6KMR0_9MICO|nr:hypothetical protein [Antiquaquibacter oligotrophicus]MDH6181289.1 hypothetical protein [Antiquaquibacter oligotrophicus]UDF13018.1 hypothetical protein LH407_12770 [Antiquaquibacter oligotrophicus]
MMLEWWNDIVRWFASDAGQTIMVTVVLPFVAILAAGLIAGLIMRGAMKRFVVLQDRQAKVAAIAGLAASARKAAVWSSLTAQEKLYVEQQTSEAEVRVRLLPVAGASEAADWASYLISSMKKNSANYGFQAEQDLKNLQDGLVAWHHKPARTRKMFTQDLATWKFDSSATEDELLTKQREWAAQQETAPFEPAKI